MPEGVVLPTSDNPFTRLKKLPNNEYTTNCGVGEVGVLLFMPITLDALLATEVGYGKPEQWRFNDRTICALIVRAIVENAYCYVYSCGEDKAIERIRPSVVDPVYLEKLEQVKKGWYGT